MKYKYIIIDVSNWYFRNFFTHKDMQTKVQGRQLLTGGIYGCLKGLESLEKHYAGNNCHWYFLFDTSKVLSSSEVVESEVVRRVDIDSNYKKSRKDQDPAFYRGLDMLMLLLQSKSANYTTILCDGYEGDDIVKPLLENISKDDPHGRRLLISEDMDWARSIDRNTFWLAKKREWTSTDFREHYGFDCSGNKVTMYKSIRGDSSDNIPKGIKGIGEGLVVKLVNEFTTATDLINGYKKCDYLNNHWKKVIDEQSSRIKLNYRLVDFIKIDKGTLDKGTTKCYYNKSKYRQLLSLLGFSLIEFMGYEGSVADDGVFNLFEQPKIERR